ncbi:MAG: sulfatase-like hydrolase/transferase [Candidatus Hydrogenedens sp.]
MKKLSRRNFLLSSTLPLFPYIYKSTNKQSNINILLIISDDLNNYTSYLNCEPELLTPNIHSLQKHSITFENAYCQYPLCHPSRTSMLTGLHPFSTGVYMSEQINSAELPILPQYLKETHYLTAGIGKVFHPKYNIENVWDFNFEIYDNLYNFIYKKDDPLSAQNFCYGPVDISLEDTNDYKIAQQAVDFIKSNKNNPWFLAIGFHTPHTPLFAPREFFKKIPKNIVKKPIVPDDDLNDIPEAGIKLITKYDKANIHQLVLERNIWEELIYAYLVRIAFLDELIGSILKNLEESKIFNNTCILLCGDNGWHLGEKKRWQKFTLWQEANKVPLILHLPDGYKGGLTLKEPAGLVDIFPTITDLLSLNKPEN